jgi:hypothetical protein
MGQCCCRTKLPPASRLTRIDARCNRTGFLTIKRFARTDARSVSCSCRKSCSGGRSAVSKNQKREVRHAKQDSDRPGVAAGSLEQASPTINWIAPLARNTRFHPDAGAAVRGQINVCETFAALESGVDAAADAAQKPAQLRSFSHLRRIEFPCRRFKQQNWRDKWLAQFKTLTPS